MSEPIMENTKPAHPDSHFLAYMYVFGALCVLTLVSFLTNVLLGQGHASLWIIMAVSCVKATLVAVIFMHLKTDWPKVYCIIIPVSIMAVMMLIVLLPDIALSWHHYYYAEKPAEISVQHDK